MSTTRTTALGLLGLSLFCSPLAAQEAKTTAKPPRLSLALEVGFGNAPKGTVKDFQDRMIRFVKKNTPENAFDDEFLKFLSRQSEKVLPVRLRVFVAPDPVGEAQNDQRSYLLVVDSAAPFDMTSMSEEEDTEAIEGMEEAWRHTGSLSAMRQCAGTNGGSRVIAGNVFGEDPAESPWFQGRNLPKARGFGRKLLMSLRKAPYYVMADIGSLAPLGSREEARRLRGLFGPSGLIVGGMMRELRGRPAIDLYWGIRPGQGMVGQFLPKAAGEAKVLGSLPFDPSFLMLANLGESGRKSLLTALKLALASGSGKDRPGMEHMRDLLDCWTGDIQLMTYLPDQGAAHTVGMWAEQKRRRMPVFGMVMKLEEGSEEAAIAACKKLIPTLAGLHPAQMRFTKKKGLHVAPFGAAKIALQAGNGLLVASFSVSDEDCCNMIEGVGDRFSVHQPPEKLARARGSLKMFFSSSMRSRVFQRQLRVPTRVQARGRGHSEAYLFGQQFGRELMRCLFTEDIVYSMSWKKSGLRIRAQF